uniref:Uncharacterized protein n=1 Tax=Anguilla anguilla TaxID=7936 RepID=A0A0E9SID7_ANGAN
MKTTTIALFSIAPFIQNAAQSA